MSSTDEKKPLPCGHTVEEHRYAAAGHLQIAAAAWVHSVDKLETDDGGTYDRLLIAAWDIALAESGHLCHGNVNDPVYVDVDRYRERARRCLKGTGGEASVVAENRIAIALAETNAMGVLAGKRLSIVEKKP